jgi:hypothetical protein
LSSRRCRAEAEAQANTEQSRDAAEVQQALNHGFFSVSHLAAMGMAA